MWIDYSMCTLNVIANFISQNLKAHKWQKSLGIHEHLTSIKHSFKISCDFSVCILNHVCPKPSNSLLPSLYILRQLTVLRALSVGNIIWLMPCARESISRLPWVFSCQQQYHFIWIWGDQLHNLNGHFPFLPVLHVRSIRVRGVPNHLMSVEGD